MRKMRVFVSLMIGISLMFSLCSCEKSEDSNVVTEESVEESIKNNVEPAELEEKEEVFVDFSGITQHKKDMLNDLGEIFTQNDIGYTSTSNGDILLGDEQSYSLLDISYDISEIAYSLYNPALNTIDTVFYFGYGIHKEKGLEADSKHAKWLYDMLNYFNCNIFSSVDDMTSQMNNVTYGLGKVFVESDSTYVEVKNYGYFASAIIREQCDYKLPEYKFMNFDSLEERESYMETIESEIREKFEQYQTEGGNIVNANGDSLVKFRCMDGNDESGLDNDLGIMVSIMNIDGSQEYSKDCLELLKIMCDYIGIENITDMDITSEEVAEQIMTYAELENYFDNKDIPFFSWQQEGGWDSLFAPVEYFNSNPFGIQYKNVRYYRWNFNGGDQVYKGIYIPATVQGIKNRI